MAKTSLLSRTPDGIVNLIGVLSATSMGWTVKTASPRPCRHTGASDVGPASRAGVRASAVISPEREEVGDRHW